MRIRTARKLHRYLGFFVGIQLLFWTLSGLYFAWNPIETVRGEHLAAEPGALSPTEDLASPSVAVGALQAGHLHAVEAVREVRLSRVLGEPVWILRYAAEGEEHLAAADARTGALLPPVDADVAAAIARADFVPDAPVAAVERVGSAGPGSEIRGRPLPLWRIDFDHPSATRIYVAADTGEVVARRNRTWRIFDFLWMFHILDFEERNDFNHWLLRVMSVLGVLTVLSGFFLFFLTSSWMVDRRREKALLRSRHAPSSNT